MTFTQLLKSSFREWKEDNAGQMGAATAYYTLFSLAPFLVLVIYIASVFLERSTAKEEIYAQLQAYIGAGGVESVRSIVDATMTTPESGWAALLSVFLLLLGASGLIAALQRAMNTIWNVRVDPERNTLLVLLAKRIFSIGLVFSLSFLLLVSLVATTAVNVITEEFVELVPLLSIGVPLLNFLLSFALVTVLFAILYKYVPDVLVPWRAVWPGAALASILFSIGQMLLSYYLSKTDLTASYGAAASFIILLLWVNFSAQILYFGAEFVRQYAGAAFTVSPRHYAMEGPEKGVVVIKKRPATWFTKAKITSRIVRFEAKSAWKLWKFKKRWKK